MKSQLDVRYDKINVSQNVCMLFDKPKLEPFSLFLFSRSDILNELDFSI